MGKEAFYMGKGINTLSGKIGHTGSMYVEAEHKNKGAKKPTVKKGGDLRASN